MAASYIMPHKLYKPHISKLDLDCLHGMAELENITSTMHFLGLDDDSSLQPPVSQPNRPLYGGSLDDGGSSKSLCKHSLNLVGI